MAAPMFSVKGVLSTPLAMMECAGSQISSAERSSTVLSGRKCSIFLLSELEKVWAALSVVLRKFLSEGKSVKIPHFGSFWLEEFVLFTAPSISAASGPHRVPDRRGEGSAGGTRYSTRRLYFGFNRYFAIKYNLHQEKIAQEKDFNTYTKILPSHLVALCEVPAYRVEQVLKEFFLYIGEGLYLGKVFQLEFPDVASLFVKKEQMLLRHHLDLQRCLLQVDSKRWPSEIRERSLAALLSDHHFESSGAGSLDDRPGSSGCANSYCSGSNSYNSSSRMQSSRPATSRHGLSGTAPPPAKPVQHPTVFISTTLHGKCFSDLVRENQWRAEREERSRRMLWNRKKKTGEDTILHGIKDGVHNTLDLRESSREFSSRSTNLPFHDREDAYDGECDLHSSSLHNEHAQDVMHHHLTPPADNVYGWKASSPYEPPVSDAAGKVGEGGLQSRLNKPSNEEDAADSVELVEVVVDTVPSKEKSGAEGDGGRSARNKNLPSSHQFDPTYLPCSYRPISSVQEPSCVDPNNLTTILEKEEPFSRPISRRYHEHSSVRDLIYSNPCATLPKTTGINAAPNEAEFTSSGRPILRRPPPSSDWEASNARAGASPFQVVAPLSVYNHFGRKRFGFAANPVNNENEYAIISCGLGAKTNPVQL